MPPARSRRTAAAALLVIGEVDDRAVVGGGAAGLHALEGLERDGLEDEGLARLGDELEDARAQARAGGVVERAELGADGEQGLVGHRSVTRGLPGGTDAGVGRDPLARPRQP